MEMKIYHCENPEENPVPVWMRSGKPAAPETEKSLVERFKENPDSFFPEFLKTGSPAPKRGR